MPRRKTTAAELVKQVNDPGEPKLTATAEKLIENIENLYELNHANRALLKIAAHNISISERASAVVEAEGTTWTDRLGNIKTRPEVTICKDANNGATSAISKLLQTLEG